MEAPFYTLASWYVRQGMEPEFVRIWQTELAPAFLAANSRAQGTLIQSLEDPRQYYSFGPWNSEADMRRAREDVAVGSVIRRLMDVCEHAAPGPYRLILSVGKGSDPSS
jgi:hypothetical protein